MYKDALAAGMEPLGEGSLCLSELDLHGGHLHESVAASVGSAISSLMAPLHHEPQHTPLHAHAPPLHHEPLEKLKCEFFLFCFFFVVNKLYHISEGQETKH